ncbi:MAG: TlpA family protein disulfide reductase [gamma proteobacterium symbiont of Taylorina sp.]|nr:TlpA family protein disulfide reductase [gamma proteobacterium symbiont of Taylorina sp.]
MKKKDLSVLGFIAVLGGLLAYLWFAPAGQPPAPDASFKDLQGNTFNLAQLRGKPLIVNFWATTCPGCVLEIPALVELSNKYASQNLHVIGVAMDYDPLSQVTEMVRQKNISYTIVPDTKGEIAKAFGNVSLTPTTFFITKEGLISRHKLGEMGHAELETSIQNIL